MMASEHDTAMMDAPGANAHFSDAERDILELWDRLQKLKVEIALLIAKEAYVLDPSHQVTDEALKAAQEGLLELRASYLLRNEAVETVMSINPTLNAVHGAVAASPIERDLLEPIEQRDAESMEVSKQTTELLDALNRLTLVKSETLTVARKNVQLAAEVVRLGQEASQKNNVPQDDSELVEEVSRLEEDMKQSRRRWRVMKGTASAVVAGSGVDWVSDPDLRDMVLDPE